MRALVSLELELQAVKSFLTWELDKKKNSRFLKEQKVLLII